MTIVVRGDERILEQVTKQLNKLIDVIKVTDYQDTAHLERDLALVKVSADKATRSELIQICDIFRAKIVDVGVDSVIIEMTGDEEKIEALLRLLRPFGIKELCRTGIVAMARGAKGISVAELEEGNVVSKTDSARGEQEENRIFRRMGRKRRPPSPF